ncbi:MAG: TonB-dependent receptor [Chitinophagaceae bacterium]|nr:MAG: TonB-dependent receptor [Chitinophagaceae bacterium]
MNLIKSTLILSFLFLLAITVTAQTTVSGTLKDAKTNEVLEFAQVVFMSPEDSSTVSAATTGLDGSFTTEINPGSYILKSSYIGYQSITREITIEEGRNRLGDLLVEISSEELREVEISAAASLFRTEADRRIFNVENMTVSDGGTAIQLLENLPSVQVDEEGGISLRGSSNILIFINGRPTNISGDDVESVLEQYPADAIKSVELITNPSARYDAEGIGGIINIILKEERRGGINGQVNASAATGHRYSGGLNLNFRRDNFNIFANYNYQYRQNRQTSETFRENFSPTATPFLDQNFNTRNYNNTHLIRTGIEYDLTENSTVRLFSNINLRTVDRERTYYNRFKNENLDLDSMSVRFLTEDRDSRNFEFGGSYSLSLNEGSSSLNIQSSYSDDETDRIEYFDQYFITEGYVVLPEKGLDQTYERPVRNKMFLFQTDFEHSLSTENERAIETGVKLTLTEQNREQIFNELNPVTNEYVENEFITNSFDYNEDVYAAYFIFRDNIDRFSYQAGLRTEYTITESFQPKIDSIHTNNYINLFPSVFLSYSLSENQDVQVNYSRRIRRPGMRSLMPFINAQDLLNLRLGNPYLEPEITDNIELSYIQSWEKYMLSASIYHRNTQNGITRAITSFDEQTSVVTWLNAAQRNNTGLELVNYFRLSNNFDATLTGNFYYSVLSGDINGSPFSDESFSWTLSLMSNIRIPKVFNVQVTGNYSGPMVFPQGRIKSRYGVNVGFRRNIMNNNGTISLNFSDIFGTQRFRFENTNENFYQEREFNWETSVITLAFTYRFRGYSERDRQRRGGGPSGMDDDDMF